MLETAQGRTLLAIARNAITKKLGLPIQTSNAGLEQAAWLNEPGATFVTLMQNGNLRGCIGSLEAHRTVGGDVTQNALAAAFRDPRFAPLTAQEFANTRIEVSLLSPQQEIRFTDEADALAQLRPDVDGVVFEHGSHRSTFLPQVWEQLPAPERFMSQLKRKAGLPDTFWSPEVRLYRYTVEKWAEH
jgi:hypothetical protein